MQQAKLERVFGGIGKGGGKFAQDKVDCAAANADDDAVKGDQNQQMSGNAGK